MAGLTGFTKNVVIPCLGATQVGYMSRTDRGVCQTNACDIQVTEEKRPLLNAIGILCLHEPRLSISGVVRVLRVFHLICNRGFPCEAP